MHNLLYKDLNMTIHKFFLLGMPLMTGLLFLIPQWPYFLAPMYFFFVTIPNLFGSFNAQRDNEFSFVLPVSKDEMVRARLNAFLVMEGAHLLTALLFAALRNLLYGPENFLMDPNAAFFGLVLVMFGLFNVVFFPRYYKTAWFYGKATVLGVAVVILFAGLVEGVLLVSSPCVSGWKDQPSRPGVYSSPSSSRGPSPFSCCNG